MEVREEMYKGAEIDKNILPLAGRIVIRRTLVEHKVAKDLGSKTGKRPNSTLLQEPSQCRRYRQALLPLDLWCTTLHATRGRRC